MKIKNKKVLLISLVLSTLLLSACKEKEVSSKTSENKTIVLTQEESSVDNTYEEPTIDEPIIVEDNTLDGNTTEVKVVVDVNKTKIYSNDNSLLGFFVPDRYFMYLDEDDNYYQINYYGNIGYVSKNDTTISSVRTINTEILKKGYLTDSLPIYDNYELQGTSFDTLDKYEFVQIHKELDNCYLVETTDNKVGFIPKHNLLFVDGKIAVVDRSDQEVRLYDDYSLLFSAPVVTGTKGNPNRETPTGIFKIYNEYVGTHPIVGNTLVDIGLSYDGNRVLHDAKRWRSDFEYGGDTYKVNGSHGCVNMSLESAQYLSDNMDVGDHVLVKE